MVGDNKQRGFIRTRLIPLACAVLVLVIGASFLYVTTMNKNGGQQPQRPQAVHATATSTPSPTPTFTAVPPSFTPTPQALFDDYFLDNSKGWLTSNVSGYTRTVDENGLTLSDTNHKILVESVPATTTFDNFLLTTTFTFEHGDSQDSAGLYVRGDNNLDHDYRIDIYGNNSFSISKESLDTNRKPYTTILVGPTHTTALKQPGFENTLSIMMQDSLIVLTINGIVVSTVSDTDYTHGQIALFVQNSMTSDEVKAIFSSIVINPLPVIATPTPDATP